MGTGGSNGSGRGPGSKDGVFTSSKLTEITTTYTKSNTGFMKGFSKDDILEATTDGKGNITFSYPKNGDYDWTEANAQQALHPTNKGRAGRTAQVTYKLLAGAVNGQTFNIDWSKVQSISGKTYDFRSQAKAAGLKWDSDKKKWVRR